MAGPLEREIKLRFDSANDARDSILAAGGAQVRARRLQSDALLDTDDGQLRDHFCALRLRVEPDRCFLTFKGPPQPSMMKLREELETGVADGTLRSRDLRTPRLSRPVPVREVPRRVRDRRRARRTGRNAGRHVRRN